jgi:hypothetical protein
LENFTITIADRSSLNTIRFIINNHHHASPEPQKKENADKNQLIDFTYKQEISSRLLHSSPLEEWPN